MHVERHSDMPGCTRCGGTLVARTEVPVGDGGVELELCLACDAGQGTAGRLVDHMLLPEEEKSVQVLADLFEAWVREGMAAKGWRYLDGPEPPREGLLEDGRSAAVVSRVGAQRDRRASLN